MQRTFAELGTELSSPRAYEIYRRCMYLPTPEKYARLTRGFLAGPSVRTCGCLEDGTLVGVLVLSLKGNGCGEILGIAVEEIMSQRGIGSFMVREVIRCYGLNSLRAETDGDAVGFYQKIGFAVTPFVRKYGLDEVQRYACELRLEA